MKRFIKEYASYKIRHYEHLKKEVPENISSWNERQDHINHIVWLSEKYLITVDEAMKELSEA